MMRIPYNTIIETRHLYEDAKKSDMFFDKIASMAYKFTMNKICRMLDSTTSKTNIIHKDDLVMFGNFLKGTNMALPKDMTYEVRGDRYIFSFILENGITVSIDTIRPDSDKFYITTKSEHGDSRVEMEFISTSAVYEYGEFIYKKLIQIIKEYLRRP